MLDVNQNPRCPFRPVLPRFGLWVLYRQVPSAFLQLLRQIIALMLSGEFSQFSKYLIAMLFVEIWRLKTKSVQIRIRNAKFSGFIFGKRQKAVPISATTQFFFYKQQIDIEPTPVGLSDQTASNFLIWAVEDEAHLFALIVARFLNVVTMDATSNEFPRGIIWFIYLDDIVFLTHISPI